MTQAQIRHGQVWQLRAQYLEGWPSDQCAWPRRIQIVMVLSGLETTVAREDLDDVIGPKLQVPWSALRQFYRRIG